MKPSVITSTANPKIKDLVKLRKHSVRIDTGLILIDGSREISLALENKVLLKEIYYCPQLLRKNQAQDLLKKLESLKLSLCEVNSSVFAKIAFGEREEGLIALAARPRPELTELKVLDDSFFVIVQAIEKPGNLGAIIRTCDAAGVTGLILCDAKTDLFNPNVIRSSLGACFSLPSVECTSEAGIQWLEANKVKIIAVTPEAKLDLWNADFTLPCAVVFGSEDKGLSQNFKTASQTQVRIPMQGKVDSLNVSATAAIILYELVRRKK